MAYPPPDPFEPPPDHPAGPDLSPREAVARFVGFRALTMEGTLEGDTVAALLRGRGHRVTRTGSPEEAWAAFQSDPAPLVVLTRFDPGAAAHDLPRRIRAHPRGRTTVILAVVGEDTPETVDSVLEAGVDDVILPGASAADIGLRIMLAERRVRERKAGQARPGMGVADDERGAKEELAHRTRELGSLYRISELTLTAPSLEAAHAEILAEIARAMDVPIVLLEELDRERDRLLIAAAHGVPLDELGTAAIPLDRTPSGPALQTGLPSVTLDPADAREPLHPALAALGARTWAAFPLSTGGAVVGTLALLHTEPREMDPRWIRMGTSLATTLAAFRERLKAEVALRDSEARYRGLTAKFQQANQELESFAYSVSHDLRAPLRTMQGFAHALLRDNGNELTLEAGDYVRRIIASGRQAERLIVDLLAYSRLTFEKIEIKPVELSAVIDQALEQVDADLRDTATQVTVDRALPSVLGSQTALVQVMANLLSNATKFVPPDRKPVVRIRAEDRPHHVRLWVEDNGIGIPEGQEERIFRVFERLSEGSDRPGTGIGLAIVRRGMQRIGGTCGVRRREDGGSAFWIDALKERRKARRPWTRRGRG